jgi:hypothetical protein
VDNLDFDILSLDIMSLNILDFDILDFGKITYIVHKQDKLTLDKFESLIWPSNQTQRNLIVQNIQKNF